LRTWLIAACLLLAGCSLRDAPVVMQQPAARIWKPPADAPPPVAQLVALHGFGDHLTTFDETATWLAGQGIVLRAYDIAGFGERPDHGFWAGSDALAAQLRERITAAKAEAPQLPLFALGESMGAAVAVLGTTGWAEAPVDGLILVAPAVWGGASMNSFNRAALKFLVRTFPGLRLSGRGLPIQASDNIEALIAHGRDPVYLKEPTAAMVGGVVQLMDDVQPLAPLMSLPVLVLMGDRDQVVPPGAQRAFTAQIGSADCLAVAYSEGWHMLLDDRQRETVWRDLAAWTKGARSLPSSLQLRCGDVPGEVSPLG
jgi:acylglycerol lipase